MYGAVAVALAWSAVVDGAPGIVSALDGRATSGTAP
jgi:hypothetical protein